jgi:hypothetical protein
LEKIKTCCAAIFLSAVDTPSLRFVFTFRFSSKVLRMISESSEISVLKIASKFHDKVEQISTARFKKFRMAITEVHFFCSSKMR